MICPHAYIGDDVNEWLRARQWAERGMFPDSGGTLDQTHFIMEVFDIIDTESAKLDG